jgi:hypothetical protein
MSSDPLSARLREELITQVLDRRGDRRGRIGPGGRARSGTVAGALMLKRGDGASREMVAPTVAARMGVQNAQNLPRGARHRQHKRLGDAYVQAGAELAGGFASYAPAAPDGGAGETPLSPCHQPPVLAPHT